MYAGGEIGAGGGSLVGRNERHGCAFFPFRPNGWNLLHNGSTGHWLWPRSEEEMTLEELAAKVAELEKRLAILEDLAGRDRGQEGTEE
jgi:hypothetical protein